MAQLPFPGMDPYLESPDLWGDLHGTLMHIFRDQLNEQVPPKYIVEMQTQVVVEAADEERWGLEPDVTVIQPRVDIGGVLVAERVAPAPMQMRAPVSFPTRLFTLFIRRRKDQRLVTVIELLSPINKRRGHLRQEYLDKRAAYFEADVHLIEIDLLRSHPRMPLEGKLPRCDYLIMVSNFYVRPIVDVWPLSVRSSLPIIPIPLLRGDDPATLDLGEALRTGYTRARYDVRIDYTQAPTPPLLPEDAAWAAESITTKVQ